MKRALITFLAVMSLSVSVAGSVATVSDARSNNGSDNGNCSERGGSNNRDHDKPPCAKKCDDDDRGHKSTPKACNDDHGHDKDKDKGHHGDD